MEWTTLISTLGFPIVACVAMAYYVKDSNDKNTEQIKEMNKTHKDETDKFVQAINNNSNVIEKLLLTLNKGE